jgi:sugar lactone lactonase YvrE
MQQKQRKNYKKVVVYHVDGTPLKPVKVPIAKTHCNFCGQKIRYIRAECYQNIPVEEDLYIVDPAGGKVQDRQVFVNRKNGGFVRGVPVERGWGGCILGYKLHKCRAAEV